MNGVKKESRWNAVKQKKTSLTRLASYDRSKFRVAEIENCGHLVDQLSSENLPSRDEAVLGLVRWDF